MAHHPPSDAPRTPFGRFASRARRPLMRAFRVTPEGRLALVHQMLARQVHDAAMYWLQLVLAMSIATLGLALGSTVVVIGAMLISPLMGPIVELGMGLAIGLPKLAGRSFARVAASAALVVIGATVITLALPFHEVTAPIAARSSPTVLDLLIAICCALMASVAAAVSGSTITTTAAGTAVAIALVPPLCVVGFGLGTRQSAIAEGAALLFIANFSAIMLFAILTFAVFGFAEDAPRLVQPAATTGRTGMGRRWPAVFRIVLPLVLLGMVFVPLRRALTEVAWEVSARQAVRREIDGLASDTVRSSVEIDKHAVRVQLVIVGDTEKAADLERNLTLRIAAAAGVVPTVEVIAVPSAQAMREAMRPPDPVTPALVRTPDLSALRSEIVEALGPHWPAATVGYLVDWRLKVGLDHVTVVEVAHIGGPLGRPAEEMLRRELSTAIDDNVQVQDIALPKEPITAPPSEGVDWLGKVAPLVAEMAPFDSLYACVGLPPEDSPLADAGRSTGGDKTSTAAARRLLALLATRVHAGPSASWFFRVQTQPCSDEVADAGPDSEPSDGPIADAAVESSAMSVAEVSVPTRSEAGPPSRRRRRRVRDDVEPPAP